MNIQDPIMDGGALDALDIRGMQSGIDQDIDFERFDWYSPLKSETRKAQKYLRKDSIYSSMNLGNCNFLELPNSKYVSRSEQKSLGSKTKIDQSTLKPKAIRKHLSLDLKQTARTTVEWSKRPQKKQSPHVGVCWYQRTNKWMVQVKCLDKRRKHIGYFETKEEAISAYEVASENQKLLDMESTNKLLYLFDFN